MQSVKDKKNVFAEYCICMFLMLICCIFCRFAISSFISVIAACFFFYLIYKYNTLFYLKYLAVFFGAVSMFVAVLIIEFQNVYLTELSTTSEFAGSLPGIILSYCTLIFILVFADNRFRTLAKKKKTIMYLKRGIPKADLPWYILAITAFTDVFFLILWLYVFRYPSFLMNLNKSLYSSLYLDNMPYVLKKLNSFSSFLIFFPILCLFKKHKILGLAGVGPYLLYCLWIGNKFGPFFWVLCVFLIVLYPKLTSERKKLIKRIFFVGVIIVGLFIIAAVVIQTNLITTGSNIVEYAMFRIAAQGQLWWKTFQKVHGIIHISEFGDEIKGILKGSADVSSAFSYGIYKIMYLCAPSTIVDDYMSKGSRFTEAGFAAAYYYLGILGCVVFAVVMGLAAAVLVNGTVQMLNDERYIRALLLLRLYMIWRTSLSMFTFYDWLGPLSIISYVLLIISHGKPLVLHHGKKIIFVL